MARPIEFEPEKALEAAMIAFWDRGADGVSLDALVTLTGASRQGLYSMFGDKRRLVIAALRHYETSVLSSLIAPLNAPDADLHAVAAFVRKVAETAYQQGKGSGCFLCQCIASEPNEEDVRAVSDAFFARLRAAVQRCCERSISKGKAPAEADPTTLGHYVVGLVQGVSTIARSRPTPTEFEAFVAQALKSLER